MITAQRRIARVAPPGSRVPSGFGEARVNVRQVTRLSDAPRCPGQCRLSLIAPLRRRVSLENCTGDFPSAYDSPVTRV